MNKSEQLKQKRKDKLKTLLIKKEKLEIKLNDLLEKIYKLQNKISLDDFDI